MKQNFSTIHLRSSHSHTFNDHPGRTMAEAAGLALGGIALASLFTTCIDVLEYFDQARNWSKDLQLGLTKVSLMKERLRQWGQAMSINSPGHESQILRHRWPQESEVIIDSLLGIREILGSTAQMCTRHKPLGEKAQWPSRDNSHIVHIIDGSAPTDPCPSKDPSISNKSCPHRSQRQRCIGAWHLKIIWIVQDRKKLSSSIADLDFLLNNLEKIGKRLQPLYKMSQYGSDRTPVRHPAGKL